MRQLVDNDDVVAADAGAVADVAIGATDAVMLMPDTNRLEF